MKSLSRLASMIGLVLIDIGFAFKVNQKFDAGMSPETVIWVGAFMLAQPLLCGIARLILEDYDDHR